MKKYVALLVALSLLSTCALGVVMATADTNSNEKVYLPEELLNDNPINPSRALETFLNNCSNKKVIFPREKTFVLERQLVIHHVKNLEIDFNGCTIQLPDNLAWARRYDTGKSIALNAITVYDSQNITFSNYIIDGNSDNISINKSCNGLLITDVNCFSSNNGFIKSLNYHQLVIYPGTRNITFNNTLFKDHGGVVSGKSDVYVENNPNDDFSFINTRVINTAIKENQGQLFYINGYNGYFDTVYAENVVCALDLRKGNHVARNFTVTNSKEVLVMQSNPKSEEIPSIVASDFTGININGSKSGGGASGVYIVACDSCNLSNFSIEMDSTSNSSWYGFRIRKYNENKAINDVVITNTEVKNAQNAAFMMQCLESKSILENITVTNTPYALKSDSCTSIQLVKKLNLVKGLAYKTADTAFQIEE